MIMEPMKNLTAFVTPERIDKALEKIHSNPEFVVEGCHYEIAREERHQELVSFIRDQFIPDEPIATCLGVLLSWSEEMAARWMAMVKENMSLVLVSDTTGAIVAIRGNKISKKPTPSDRKEFVSRGYKKLQYLEDSMRKLCDVYEHYNVDEVVEFAALAVHRDYRMRGIGLKIMKAAVALVKNLGFNGIVIKGEGSSNYANKIFENAGFEILAELVYAEFERDGELVFKNMQGHKSAKQYGMLI